MSDNLKDYLFSFFSHKRAKNIFLRPFIITFINIIIVFFSLLFSLFLGEEISFKNSFSKACNYQNLLEELLTENIVVKDNEISLSLVYDSYLNDTNDYLNKYGYEVIVDTRDKATTYEDFSLSMKTEDLASEISYEEYLGLNEEEKSEYHVVITHTGITLEVIENTNKYENYLNNLEDKSEYLNLKDKYDNHEIEEEEYASELYILYGNSYYPEDVYDSDYYGKMPTMFSYYRTLLNSDFSNNDYLFIYSDAIEASFKASSKQVSYVGEFTKAKTYDIKNDKGAIKDFIIDSFKAGSEYRLTSYFIVCFFIWFAFMIILIIEALIFRLILKKINPFGVIYYLKLLNLQGSFMLFASLVSFIYVLIGSFYIYKLTLALSAAILMLLIVIIRTIIFFIKEGKFDDSVKEEY